MPFDASQSLRYARSLLATGSGDAATTKGEQALAALIRIACYALVFTGFWWLSKQLEMIPGSVSWFLPAGVRVTALMFCRRRHWWQLWIGEIVGNAFLTTSDHSLNGPLAEFASDVLPFLMYAVPANWLLGNYRARVAEKITTPFSALALTAVLGANLAGALWSLNLAFSHVITPSEVPGYILSVALGDLVGISLFLPFVVILEHGLLNGATATRLALLMVGGACAPLLLNFAAADYFWRILLLSIVGVSGYRYGLTGGCVASGAISALIIASHLFAEPIGSMREDQFYVIFLTFSAIALGEAISRKNALMAELNAQNVALSESGLRLQLLNAAIQDLASRLVEADERQRKVIARELHDGLGQMLSALRIQLRAIRKANPPDADDLENLDHLLGVTYDTAKKIMFDLQPTAIEVELESALRARELTSLLTTSDVDYQLIFDVDGICIDEAVRLNIFRIVQEAANNCVKHASAKRFSVTLKRHRDRLELSISDDGHGFDVEATGAGSSGAGLRNIRDRASMMGADYRLSSMPQGTSHQLSIPIRQTART